MSITLGDVQDILSQEIELAAEGDKKITFCPLTKRFHIFVDGKSLWSEGERNVYYAIDRYNTLVKEVIVIDEPRTLGDIIKEQHERSKETRVDVDNGKYTIVIPYNRQSCKAFHNGKKGGLCSNNMIIALAVELHDAKEKLGSMVRLANVQENAIEMLTAELNADT